MTDSGTVFQVFQILDHAGIALFALSGGIIAARKGLDPFGAAVIGMVAGTGGGTIRDVVLGSLPVTWVLTPHLLLVALLAGLAGYYGSELVRGPAGARQQALLWADAAGLAVFSVIGARAGLEAGAPAGIALVTGVLSAAFGGVLRDVLVNDVPLIFREDIYALAALFGAGVYVGLGWLGLSEQWSAPVAALAAFTLRGCAIHYGWRLPAVGRID